MMQGETFIMGKNGIAIPNGGEASVFVRKEHGVESGFPPPGIRLSHQFLASLQAHVRSSTTLQEHWQAISSIQGNNGRVAKHSIGVAWFSFQIGKAYGRFTAEQLQLLVAAALDHDEGQRQPHLRRLVNMQEAFSDAQREVANTHTDLGYLSLTKDGFPIQMTLPALAHHTTSEERQLTFAQGEALLFTDIIAAADGIEASTSLERSWRPPLNLKEAFRMVVANEEGRYSQEPKLLSAVESACAYTASSMDHFQTRSMVSLAQVLPTEY